MHPVIARFLSVDAALSVLEGTADAAALDPEAAALWAAAQAHPEERGVLLRAGRRRRLPSEAERAQIVLAVDAARRRLAADARVGPKLEAVHAALRAQGAPEHEGRYLVGVAIAEEAFAFEGSPDDFDDAFLLETLDELVVLAGIDEGRAVNLLERFVRAGADEATARPLRLRVGESLLDAAWSDGSQPISVEHLDDALEHLAATVPASEFARAADALAELVGFLATAGCVGPLRRERLLRLVERARDAGPESMGFDQGDPDDEADEGAGDAEASAAPGAEVDPEAEAGAGEPGSRARPLLN